MKVLLAGVVAALLVASPAAAVPPVITITAPPAATNDTTPTIAGTAGHDAGDFAMVSVLIKHNGSAMMPFTLTVDPMTGAFSGDVPTPLAEQGAYSATVTQGNNLGDTYQATRDWRVDTEPPVVTLNAVPPRTASATPTFAGTRPAAVLGDTDGVTVELSNGDTVSCCISASDDWEAPVVKALAAGTYTAQAVRTDDAGNRGVSTPRTFTVDTQGPTVTIITPAAGATVPSQVTVKGTAGTAPGDASTVKVTLDGWTKEVPVGADGAFTAETFPLVVGNRSVTVSQTDDLGHTTTATRGFTVQATQIATPTPTVTPPDTTKPKVTVVGKPTCCHGTHFPTVILHVRVSEPVTLTAKAYYHKGLIGSSKSAQLPTFNRGYRIVIPLRKKAVKELRDFNKVPIRIALKAVDTAGNVSFSNPLYDLKTKYG